MTNFTDESEWRASLKEGDLVIVESDTLRRERVTKVTKTQILVGRTRYRRKNGSLVGGSAYSFTRLLQPTEARLATCRRHGLEWGVSSLIRGLYSLRLNPKLSNEDLSEVHDLLKRADVVLRKVDPK